MNSIAITAPMTLMHAHLIITAPQIEVRSTLPFVGALSRTQGSRRGGSATERESPATGTLTESAVVALMEG